MLDYYMKGFTTGKFFDKEFIFAWNQDPTVSQEILLEHAIDYHDYLENIGFRYKTFNEILIEVMGGESPHKVYQDCFNISYQIIFKQNKIYKTGSSLSYEGGFDIKGAVEGNPQTPEEQKHYDYLLQACSLMCEQIEELLPKLPMCKKYFAVLYFANFCSYYCNSLKEEGKIPLIDRSLEENTQHFCPSIFPPIPVSYEDELQLPLMALFSSMTNPQLSSFQTFLKIPISTDETLDQAYEAVYESVVNHIKGSHPLKKLTEQQYGDLIFEIMQFCKKRYQAYQKNLQAVFNGAGFQNAMTDGNVRQKFFQQLNYLIKNSSGIDKKEYIKVKDGATKWFADPLNACFENMGFLFSPLDGSIKYVGDCNGKKIEYAGGCGIAVENLEGEPSWWLGYFHRGISIQASFEDMEEVENPQFVAVGYLYPPLPGNPLSDQILAITDAIISEDYPAFTDHIKGFSHWDFKSPNGQYLVHYAAQCKKPEILELLVQKGAKLNVRDGQGFTPLHYAAVVNASECVDLILAHAPEQIEALGEEGETPLFLAARSQSGQAMGILLEHGANPNAKITNDFTPLFWLIKVNDFHLCMRLLAEEVDVNDAFRDGTTPLICAIEMGLTQIPRRLVECGANVNRKRGGLTPLHIAIENQNYGAVEVLLEFRGTITTEKTPQGETALEMAKRIGNPKVLSLLSKFHVQ